MRLLLVTLLGVGAGSCSNPSTSLLIPPELLDGTFASAIVLVQANEAIDSEVFDARMISLSAPEPARINVEDRENSRLRLLAYAEKPSELAITLGPLARARPDEGLPLPDPQIAYVSPALEDGLLEWTRMEAIAGETIPLRLPGSAPSGDCEGAHAEAWRVPGLELVEPRGMLAADSSEIILAGQWTTDDGLSPKETLLVRVTDLEGSPRIETLVEPSPADSYRDMIWVGDGVLLASTTRGLLTELDLNTGRFRSVRLRAGHAQWELSAGEDGTVVAFDANDDLTPSPRAEAQLIDLATLTSTVMDAPEALRLMEVLRRDFMIGVGDRTIYRFDGASWIEEHALEYPVTELARLGDRFVAVVSGSVVLERSASGQWTPIDNPVSTFDLRKAAFFPNGRLVLGGAGGIMLQFFEGTWCTLPRPLSRAVRALAPADDRTGFAVTYSQSSQELVGVTRLRFDP